MHFAAVNSCCSVRELHAKLAMHHTLVAMTTTSFSIPATFFWRLANTFGALSIHILKKVATGGHAISLQQLAKESQHCYKRGF